MFTGHQYGLLWRCSVLAMARVSTPWSMCSKYMTTWMRSGFRSRFTAHLQTTLWQCGCSPFWNFSIASNVILYERRCCQFLPPNAEVELMRGQLVSKLRQNYQELCRTRECKYQSVGQSEHICISPYVANRSDSYVTEVICAASAGCLSFLRYGKIRYILECSCRLLTGMLLVER